MDCPIDFTDPKVQHDPFKAYRELREGAPVCRDLKTGIWQVTPYNLVFDMTRDTEHLSNRANLRLPTGELADKINGVYENGAVCPMEVLVGEDAPVHTRHRALVEKTFTVSRVRQMEEYLSGLIDELIVDLRTKDTIEFVMEFGMLLPGMVMADQMGFPRGDVPLFRRWSDAVMESKNPDIKDERAVELAHTLRDFHAYLLGKMAEYRERPADKLLSDLIHVEQDGQTLTDREVVSIARQLVVAGIESTANAMASGISILANDPALQDTLRAEPDLIVRFVEEVLRLESPFQGLFRITKEDTSVDNVVIPAGDQLMLRFAAANRDPKQFPDPDRVILDRKNGRSHLAFGAGAHFCIGNQLARSEIRIALTALLKATSKISIAGGEDSMVRVPNYFIRGFQRLELAVTWA